MRITNQILVNQLKKMAGNSKITTDGQNLKVGAAFTAKIANVFNGLLTLEIAPRVYIEARDTTGAQYQEGDVVEFVVTEHDSEGKVFIKAMSPEVMAELDQKELQQVLKQTGIPVTKDNMTIVKQLMLNKMPVTEENVRLIANAKVHFEKVVDLAQEKNFVLTKENMQKSVKEVLIEQYKQEGNEKSTSPQTSDVSKLSSASSETKSLNEAQTKFEELDLKEGFVKNTENAAPKNVKENQTLSLKENLQIPKEQEVQLGKELPEKVTTKLEEDAYRVEKETLEMADKGILEKGVAKDQTIGQETPLSQEAIKELGELVKNLNPEKLVFLLKNQLSFSMNNAMRIEKMIVGKEQLAEQIQNFADAIEKYEGGREVAKAIQSALKGFEVTDLYDKERVDNQLKDLTQALEKAVASGAFKENDQGIRNQLTELRQSVDFLNQLNDQMTYLQMPLVLNDQQNQVEIYVQRDQSGKKKINPKDTKIFISLDTNHLDLVQVLVEVKDQTLNLNFRLGDELVEKLVRSNESMLVGQMELLGFKNVQFQYAIRDEKMDLTNMVRLESAESINKIDVRV